MTKYLPVPRIRRDQGSDAMREPSQDKPCHECSLAKRNVWAFAYKAMIGNATWLVFHCAYHGREVDSQKI